MMLRLGRVALALLVGLLANAPAWAADDAAACASGLGEELIAACSRLIEKGNEKGAALARLYSNRCAARNHEHEADRALADCSEAIGLDPQLAAARVGRGDSWRLKREFDRAIAD